MKYEELRKKCTCEHGNALLCKKCKYNPSRFLNKWENKDTSEL